MEAFVFLAVVLILGLLAFRHGRDSRDGIGSKEQELARHGVTWEGRSGASSPSQAGSPATAPWRDSHAP